MTGAPWLLTIDPFRRLAHADAARPTALAVPWRQIRRDLGQDITVLSEAELLVLRPCADRPKEAAP